MALLTKKEFSERCGIPTNALSVYVKRKKVQLTGELIDDTLDINKAFIVKMVAKMNRGAAKKAEKPIVLEVKEAKNITENEETTQNEPLKDGDIPTYEASERLLKHLDTLKRAEEIEKLRLDLSKKRGEVVPSELIKPVLLQHNMVITTEFKNGAEDIIRVFSKKRGLSVNEAAEMRGELIRIINDSITRATGGSKKSIEAIVNEFTEKRGVGERN